jgi:hypothetical protein
MNKAAILRKANKLVKEIHSLYDQLDNAHQYFFDAHHDTFRVQLDCAIEDRDEIEYYYLAEGRLSDARSILKNLEDTYTWAKAVINLQSMLDLPKCIYG